MQHVPVAFVLPKENIEFEFGAMAEGKIQAVNRSILTWSTAELIFVYQL